MISEDSVSKILVEWLGNIVSWYNLASPTEWLVHWAHLLPKWLWLTHHSTPYTPSMVWWLGVCNQMLMESAQFWTFLIYSCFMMQKLSYSDLENNTQDVESVRISRDQFIFWYKNEKKQKENFLIVWACSCVYQARQSAKAFRTVDGN